jgi:hypothetical protein
VFKSAISARLNGGKSRIAAFHGKQAQIIAFLRGPYPGKA